MAIVSERKSAESPYTGGGHFFESNKTYVPNLRASREKRWSVATRSTITYTLPNRSVTTKRCQGRTLLVPTLVLHRLPAHHPQPTHTQSAIFWSSSVSCNDHLHLCVFFSRLRLVIVNLLSGNFLSIIPTTSLSFASLLCPWDE